MTPAKLSIAINGALVTTTAAAILWMFQTFASAEELDSLRLEIAYGQFYDRLDDYEEALEEGRDELAEEYRRRMERLRAQICEQDPEWERCEK